MKIALGVILVFLLTVLILLWLLPAERIGETKVVLDAPREDIFNIVTDLNNQHWRTSIKSVQVLEAKDGEEVWQETPQRGPSMRFKTRVKLKPERFEIEVIEHPGIEAHWVGVFREMSPSSTEVHFLERIKLKGFVTKTLSYLFFDVQNSVEKYTQDLKNQLERRKEPHNG